MQRFPAGDVDGGAVKVGACFPCDRHLCVKEPVIMRDHLLFVIAACAALSASAQQFPSHTPGIGPLTMTASAWPRSHGTHDGGVRGGAPYNDLCENAVIHPLEQGTPVTILGDNTGSTDTENFGNPVSWEAFSIGICATVTLDYCGTDPLFEFVYSILITGCPDFVASVQNNGTSFCDDGNTTIVYENLPPGIYYIPVLRMTGAVGPYTIHVSAGPCDGPPLNDLCANAQELPVVEDCSTGATVGTNANTISDGSPWCSDAGAQFQDVWYTFNSGTATEVLITIGPGTIGDIGVEVMNGCSGTSILCATGTTEYMVDVEPDMGYVVRVFSNNDLGLGGTFDICVSIPTGACDAGAPVTLEGDTSVVICVGEGPIVLADDPAGEGSVFVVTDSSGTIVLFADSSQVEVDGLSSGTYQVWSVAFAGELGGAVPGQPLSGLTTTGDCLDVSDASLEVVIEVCTAVHEQMGTPLVRMDNDHALIWQGTSQHIDLRLHDTRGALVFHQLLSAVQGQVLLNTSQIGLCPGIYAVCVGSGGTTTCCNRVFVH